MAEDFKAVESSLNIVNWNLDIETDYNQKYHHTLVMINAALEQAVIAGPKQEEEQKGICCQQSKKRQAKSQAPRECFITGKILCFVSEWRIVRGNLGLFDR